MPLASLPPELIFLIVLHVDTPSLSSLARCSHFLHSLLSRTLLQRALEHNQGFAAIAHAARINSRSLLRALLSVGARPSHPPPTDAYSSLHYAALHGNKEMFELLLSHGADLEWWGDPPKEHLGQPPFKAGLLYPSSTALGCAVMQNDAEMTRYILDAREARGISNDTSLSECWSLYQLAVAEGMIDIVRAFVTRKEVDCASLGWLLREPIYVGNAEMVDAILCAGADVEAAPSTWRPLHSAVYEGFPEVVKTLLRHGAEVDALSQYKHDQPKTPLVVAAKIAAVGYADSRSLCFDMPHQLVQEEMRSRQGAKETMAVLAEWGADVDWAIHLTRFLQLSEEEKEKMIAILRELPRKVPTEG
ncbi:ankyrin repeat-containing domain protein [Sphaerosporella brunnea]|uniref:Ankyrin repeat-containing domain protein n=1 Tax=Sphaerosporella brunnea TaxID=1250544 RepID=A0A5J5F907_9PEZI|nr:ankyrin repeat-containing domain protein [Sphaerosporella brunnea]